MAVLVKARPSEYDFKVQVEGTDEVVDVVFIKGDTDDKSIVKLSIDGSTYYDFPMSLFTDIVDHLRSIDLVPGGVDKSRSGSLLDKAAPVSSFSNLVKTQQERQATTADSQYVTVQDDQNYGIQSFSSNGANSILDTTLDDVPALPDDSPDGAVVSVRPSSNTVVDNRDGSKTLDTGGRKTTPVHQFGPDASPEEIRQFQLMNEQARGGGGGGFSRIS